MPRGQRLARSLSFCFPAIAVLLSLAAPARAAVFTKIVDTTMNRPYANDRYTMFDTPVWDGTNAAFYGRTVSGDRGIWVWTGSQLDPVGDRHANVPAAGGHTFGDVQEPSIDGGRVAFEGFSSRNGIYSGYDVNSLSRIIDSVMPYPLATNNLAGAVRTVNGASVMGGNTVFWASGTLGKNGIYRHDGTNFFRIAERNTSVAGFGALRDFRNKPSYDGTNTAFIASNAAARMGMFLHNGTSISTLADTNMAIPDGTGNFTFLGHPGQDGGKVAFKGWGNSNQTGIYWHNGSTLAMVAERGGVIPGQPNLQFSGFEEHLSVDAGRIAFIGTGANGFRGLYLYDSGSVNKLLDTGDLLDGKAFTGLSIYNDSLRGFSGVFHVTFADLSQAVYKYDFQGQINPVRVATTNPEPGTLALLGGGLVVVARRRRRK